MALKILQLVRDTDGNPITSIPFSTQRFAYASNGMVEYQGFAEPLSDADGDEVWFIVKFEYSGTQLIKIRLTDSSPYSFNKEWDEKTTYFT